MVQISIRFFYAFFLESSVSLCRRIFCVLPTSGLRFRLCTICTYSQSFSRRKDSLWEERPADTRHYGPICYDQIRLLLLSLRPQFS